MQGGLYNDHSGRGSCGCSSHHSSNEEVTSCLRITSRMANHFVGGFHFGPHFVICVGCGQHFAHLYDEVPSR